MEIKLTDKKEPVIPNWKETEFAKTFEGQIMLHLEKSVDDKHPIESLLISWSMIEQISLPRLIKFVADRLKIELPSDIQRLNLQTTNLVYYCLSHDKLLFNQLEKGRKYRNEIVHQMDKEDSISKIEKNAAEATIFILEILKEINDRFAGKTLIPSINLYRNGWNDALSNIVDRLKGTILNT